MLSAPSRQTVRILFRYILTGGTSAVVDVSIFAVLHRMFTAEFPAAHDIDHP